MINDYKPSMFNRIVSKHGEMLLYNSRIGDSSVTYVPADLHKQVSGLLSTPTTATDDVVYKQLISYGFLVPRECDEKRLRDYLFSDFLASSDLDLVIHLTRNCNFRCIYCYMGNHTHEMLSEDTQKGIVNFIRKNIMRHRSVYICWFGGEPLLGIDMIKEMSQEIMDICKKFKKPYAASMNTNGYLLTEENVKILLDANVGNIVITIDGIKELHDTYRVLADGSPSFDVIIQNLKAMKKIRDRRLTSVTIRSNITKKHLDTLDEYYAYFDEHFGDDDRFSLFIRPVYDPCIESTESIKEDIIHYADMGKIYEHFAQYSSGLKFRTNFRDIKFGGSACTSKRHNKFTFACDGSVHKCDESLDKPIGRLSANGFMEIDLSSQAEWALPCICDRCDECFYSCSCLMDACPKQRVIGKSEPCSRNFEELDSLIWLLYKSQNTRTLV